MIVFKCIEQFEGVAFALAGIEHNDFVLFRSIVFLIAIEECAATEIREHLANAMDKHVWMLVSIVSFNML